MRTGLSDFCFIQCIKDTIKERTLLYTSDISIRMLDDHLWIEIQHLIFFVIGINSDLQIDYWNTNCYKKSGIRKRFTYSFMNEYWLFTSMDNSWISWHKNLFHDWYKTKTIVRNTCIIPIRCRPFFIWFLNSLSVSFKRLSKNTGVGPPCKMLSPENQIFEIKTKSSTFNNKNV